MRVFVRVPMTGKMLAAGNNPALAQAVDPLLAERDYFLRVRSERAVTDYRIFGFELTSSTGAKSRLIPTAASSSAVARAAL